MNADLESKIQSKQAEFEEAKKSIEKYSALVPLSCGSPIGHSASEMKKDYDNFNRIQEEYMSLLRQERDSR